MNITVITIATSVYKEYIKKYFLPSITNLFPNEKKNVVLVTDGLSEYDGAMIDGNTHVDCYDQIDYPYPIINLCKFQIVEHYVNKYYPETDIVMYFDADTIIFEKPQCFWDDLKYKLLGELSDKLVLSLHPHYLYNENMQFGNEYFFPLRGTVAGVYNIHEIINKKKQYVMTSFFMCNINALGYFVNKVYQYAAFDLRTTRTMPELTDETYINTLNVVDNIDANKNTMFLDRYITITPYIYQPGHPDSKLDKYNNNFPDIDTIFINQKFDIELKNNKRISSGRSR